MFCPQCGSSVPDAARACPQCGTELSGAEGPEAGGAFARVSREVGEARSFGDDLQDFKTTPVEFDGERITFGRVVVSTSNIACAYVNVPRIAFPLLAVIVCAVLFVACMFMARGLEPLAALALIVLVILVVRYILQVTGSIKSVVVRTSAGNAVLIQSNNIQPVVDAVMPLVSDAIKTHQVHAAVSVPNARVVIEDPGSKMLGL